MPRICQTSSKKHKIANISGSNIYGKISIISGVFEGDLVISEGVSKVRDKAKVKIIKTEK